VGQAVYPHSFFGEGEGVPPTRTQERGYLTLMTPPHKNPLSGVTPCEAVARDLRPEGGRYPVLRGTGGEGVPPSLFGEGVGIPPLVFLTGG